MTKISVALTCYISLLRKIFCSVVKQMETTIKMPNLTKSQFPIITLVGSFHALQLFFVGFLLWDEFSDDYRVK
jgi:hypothetical protein